MKRNLVVGLVAVMVLAVTGMAMAQRGGPGQGYGRHGGMMGRGDAPLAPVVLFVKSAGNTLLSHPEEEDLSLQEKTPHRSIKGILQPHQTGIDPTAYLDASNRIVSVSTDTNAAVQGGHAQVDNTQCLDCHGPDSNVDGGRWRMWDPVANLPVAMFDPEERLAKNYKFEIVKVAAITATGAPGATACAPATVACRVLPGEFPLVTAKITKCAEGFSSTGTCPSTPTVVRLTDPEFGLNSSAAMTGRVAWTGNGFSFSRLRPKGALVQTSAGQATGPVGFLRVYDHAFGEIAQGDWVLPETVVFTNSGLLRLEEIVNSELPGWQEHSLAVPTDDGLKTSPRGYNNGVADLLRVHTRQGISLTGTPNHKVKIMTDNGPQWKEIQDLAKGDWILVRLGEHTGKLQALRKPSKKHGNQVMPELPTVLDEELAFFLGYLAGDGFVAQGEDDHRVGVNVAHSSYLMNEMPVLMQRLFQLKVHQMQKPNDTSSIFVMDNPAVKDFLLMNGLGKQTSRYVSVPRLFRQSPQNIVGIVMVFLAGTHREIFF